MDLVLLNGRAATLDLSHRGLAYGDGLFETCLVTRGRVHFYSKHLARLSQGCNALKIPFDQVQIRKLTQQINDLVANIAEPHALKFMVLRKSVGRGYDFDPKQQGVDVIVSLTAYKRPGWVVGARVVTSTIPITENAYLAGHKHLNRLDSVLSRQEARQQNANDALMVSAAGHVIESTMANVYFKLNGQWLTPTLSVAGVDGIIRQVLLQQFGQLIEVQDIKIESLTQVESAFMTNSLLGLIPITELNDKSVAQCQSINTFNDFLRQSCD